MSGIPLIRFSPLKACYPQQDNSSSLVPILGLLRKFSLNQTFYPMCDPIHIGLDNGVTSSLYTNQACVQPQVDGKSKQSLHSTCLLLLLTPAAAAAAANGYLCSTLPCAAAAAAAGGCSEQAQSLNWAAVMSTEFMFFYGLGCHQQSSNCSSLVCKLCTCGSLTICPCGASLT